MYGGEKERKTNRYFRAVDDDNDIGIDFNTSIPISFLKLALEIWKDIVDSKADMANQGTGRSIATPSLDYIKDFCLSRIVNFKIKTGHNVMCPNHKVNIEKQEQKDQQDN